MSRWRVIIVVVLVALPFVALDVVGSVYLWVNNLAWYVWWPLAGCMALGYLLGWYWQRKKQLLRPVHQEQPLYWTERDKQAWKLIEARAKDAEKLPTEKLTDFDFYFQTGQEMAAELARFYHPSAKDP